MNDFQTGMQLAASALDAQSQRLRTIAENLANAESTALTPGGDPYRRQVPVFSATLDRALGAQTVRVERIVKDSAPFRLEFDPGHPAAGEDGYVKLPNVEMMDLRAAQQSYEANLGTMDVIRSMANATLQILS